MEKLRIYICTHKPYNGFCNNIYIPLHLGRINSPFRNNEMRDYLGDDTGENISSKIDLYSEGTGIYWVWKNVHDVEYVGICHYRRFFGVEFTEENIDFFFENGTGVLMVKKRVNFFLRWRQLLKFICMEDWTIMIDCIGKLYPEYIPTVTAHSNCFYDIAFNMLVCKKEVFDGYAKWIFDICGEIEKMIKPSPYSNSRRVMGYIMEFLTPIYFIHNNIKIKHLPYIFEGKKYGFSAKQDIPLFLLQTLVYPFIKNKKLYIYSSAIRGLEKDGIKLQYVNKQLTSHGD